MNNSPQAKRREFRKTRGFSLSEVRKKDLLSIKLSLVSEAFSYKLANDPAILGTHIRAKAMINRSEGVGASEAPRGTLFHHYWVNDDGVLQKVNLVIATSQNNLAMNHTVRQLATRYIDGNKITEGILNRIEAGIRCFDPCLSCSTHAIGQMPLYVQLVNTQNEVIDEVRR